MTETARVYSDAFNALPTEKTFEKNDVEALQDESIFQKFAHRCVIKKDGDAWRVNAALTKQVQGRDWYDDD
jgi:hypothetical protein